MNERKNGSLQDWNASTERRVMSFPSSCHFLEQCAVRDLRKQQRLGSGSLLRLTEETIKRNGARWQKHTHSVVVSVAARPAGPSFPVMECAWCDPTMTTALDESDALIEHLLASESARPFPFRRKLLAPSFPVTTGSQK